MTNHHRETNPLRLIRKARKWSMMDAAARLQVSFTTINVWENGGSTPNAGNMMRIGQLATPPVNDKEIQRRWDAWIKHDVPSPIQVNG